MAIQAISWVFSQKIHPSTSKFVLVALANFMQEDATAWCATSTISEITSLERKTILRAFKNLQEQGYIEDTGKRKGYTKSIKVFRIAMPDAVLLTLPKQSRFSPKQSRFSRQAVPKTASNPYKLSVNDPKDGFQQKRCKCGAIATRDGICGVCYTKKYVLNR